jgi:Mce-associated membrane protein
VNARTKSLSTWAALCAAVLVCALGGWSYAQARGDDTLAYAKARDAAIADGRRHLARLNSMDGKSSASVKSGLTGWLAASTGPLHDRLRSTREKDSADLTESGATARGKVTDAALTALDERAGTATLIATVDVEITPRTGKGGTERKRFEAALARTGHGWKIKALDAIPVGSGG